MKKDQDQFQILSFVFVVIKDQNHTFGQLNALSYRGIFFNMPAASNRLQNAKGGNIKAKTDKKTVKHIIGYGCIDCGGSITPWMVACFMTRFLQVHMQFNAGVLATMLLIWNIWDAVNDPLTGTIMDMCFAKANHPQRSLLISLFKSASNIKNMEKYVSHEVSLCIFPPIYAMISMK